jgi:hypothetical protein
VNVFRVNKEEEESFLLVSEKIMTDFRIFELRGGKKIFRNYF